MDVWLVILVVLESFYITNAIDCYNCTGIRNVSSCHQISDCPNHQHCFVMSYGIGVNQTFTLGCANETMCGITTSTAATTVALTTPILHIPTSPPASVPTTHIFTTTTDMTFANLTDDNSTTTEAVTMTKHTTAAASAGSGAPNIIGRREWLYQEDDFMFDEPQGCKMCCHTDACNKHLCELPVTPTQPDSVCHDKQDFGCDVAIKYYNVCSDIQKAKVLCKKSCNLCALVDGKWSEWGNWSRCDVTCGNGTRQRIRVCGNPEPVFGGDNCTGSDTDREVCTEQNCPVDGAWGDWMSWSGCSVTCGIGLQNRDRNCSNPFPDADGLFCLGAARDDKICIKNRCHDDAWLEWSIWSKCSQTCDFGLMTRTRDCNSTSLFGHSCTGDTHETKLCKDRECQVDASDWLDWSAWSDCSRTCDTGLKARSRDCNGTENSCFGDIHESDLCTERDCADPVSAFLVNGVVIDGPENGTIILSRVLTNVGDDYNSSTGQFKCRIPGVYSFFVSIEKQSNVNQAFCQLMRNGNATIYVGSRSAFIHDNTFQQASNSAVLELDIGDFIYLGRCSAPETFTTKSTFSGSLLVVQERTNQLPANSAP